MTRDIKYYKDLEKLNYSLYKNLSIDKPEGWTYLDNYYDKRTGFYAEAYKNPEGEVVMVIKGTDVNKMHTLSGIMEFSKDFVINSLPMEIRKVPNQVEPAYKFYNILSNKYGDVLLSGYSLGGSVAEILGNELGVETVTYESYGVGNIVQPKYTNQITNFGNENDPIFLKKIDYQLGRTFIVPNSQEPVSNEYSYDMEKSYKPKNINNLNIMNHFPNKSGDIANAFEYTSRPFKLHANYDYYDDGLFDISNKVIYNSGDLKLDELSSEEIDLMLDQYDENGQKFPSREEMERRVRFGELIYVENYTRSDGTKVSGYYRRYPQR